MIPNLTYDVGMHNGDDAAYYLRQGYRVVAIEANPVLAAQGAERFAKAVAAGDLTILNIGISDQEGELPFWVCDGVSEWSSFDKAIASRDEVDHHQIVITCRRFGSILKEFGVPYYLKLDIEGNEIYCLRDLAPPDLPRFVSFEKTVKAIEALAVVRDLGYTGFKLISQHNLLPVEYPVSPEQRRYERVLSLLKSRNIFLRVARRLGAKVWLRRLANRTRTRCGWVFPPGSSGPFGEDLAGRWQSFDEMVETLGRANAAWGRNEASPFWGDKDYSFWADFHARREA
jgi:FkbM family methyltransferase